MAAFIIGLILALLGLLLIAGAKSIAAAPAPKPAPVPADGLLAENSEDSEASAKKKSKGSKKAPATPAQNARMARLSGAASVVLGALLIASSAVTIVQPRTVGVKVAFGKPTGTLGNGLHLKAPWEKIEKLDGAMQNDIYRGDSDVDIRLGNNSRASADASIQWQLKTDDAMGLFLDYKTFDNIRTNLVDRNFRAAMNEVMAGYNPLDSVKTAQGGADLDALSKQVLEKMRVKVGSQIEIKSVTIPLINFDQSTQDRINELQAEIARTRVAEQKKATNKAEAEANKILEQSVTDQTLTSKCLDIVAKSGQSPLGCFPGSSVTPTIPAGTQQK